MALITLEKLQSLAPDPVSQERAKQCAAPFRWQLLEGTERVLWGEYKTPANPFYTAVDLDGPGFKCSCPSRKFPCKHALGLALMIFIRPDAFRFGHTMPDDVEKWIQGRDKRKSGILKTSEPSEVLPEPIPEPKKAREWTWDLLVSASRLDEMKQGALELETWLKDLLGRGLAGAESLNRDNWEFISKRMVDAKLGSIGRKMRILASQTGSDNWHEKVLKDISLWHLTAGGLLNFEKLDISTQLDILQFAGANVKKDLLAEEPGITDNWQILGVTQTMEENLTARKTWLYGFKSEQYAMVLDFAFGSQPFEVVYKAGSSMEATVVFYPGTNNFRAIVSGRESVLEDILPVKGFDSMEAFQKHYASLISNNPWTGIIPFGISEAFPVEIDKQWHLSDKNGQSLPMRVEGLAGWKLLSIGAGQPFTIFGEWDGEQILPLAAWQDEVYFELKSE
ncbi:MAG: SWIM zinc finger family protein [Saprospiraceae bacterium]|nr:SWIM zinc finger family protein [Saprospiraceae bacterium]